MDGIDNRNIWGLDLEILKRMISVIPSNIFFKDTELRYQFCSHKWREQSPGNIIGKTDLEIRLDKENAIPAMEADREIIRTGIGCRYVIKSVVEDTVSYLELIKEPVKDENGKVLGIVGLINDVTEQTLLSHKIKEMSEELEKKYEELEGTNIELKTTLDAVEKMIANQKMFTASMNHELRSPLNGIIGLLQMLKNDKSLEQKQQEYVHHAYESSQLMLGIVNDLLDIAKMDTEEFSIQKDVFDIFDFSDSVKKTSENLASEKGLLFTVDVEEKIPAKLMCDETRVKQVVNNIVSNSIKYSDKGEILLQIRYSDGKLILICKDEGQGMSEETLKELFIPFARFNEKKNKNIQGTGLGLSIVKKIVDKMGGSIKVESKLNVGTTFTIEIPAEICLSFSSETINKNDETATSEVPDFSDLRLLCVDDTKVNLIVFKGLLKDTGINVDTAYSGMEAIKMADTNKYDMIFMDYQMPKLNGIETFRKIRSDSLMNKDTPTILLTADIDKGSDEEWKREGFAGYLSKPVFANKLISAIQELYSDGRSIK